MSRPPGKRPSQWHDCGAPERVPQPRPCVGTSLLRGTIIKVIGPPDGKTILAQQIAFSREARRVTVLYFTGT